MKTGMKRNRAIGVAAVVAATAAMGLSASAEAAILLNFGTMVSNDTNSPVHAIGGVTGTSWNLITSADVGSGIVDDAGGATGVAVNLGKESGAATKVLDWSATGYSTSALGSQQNDGIYAGNAKSGTFVNNGSNSNISIGVRISGLAAGTYDLYMNARNTNSVYHEGFNVWFTTVANGSGNTDYNALTALTLATPGTPGELLNQNPNSPTTWVSGVSYLKHTFTINAGDDLVVIDEGFDDPSWDFINSTNGNSSNRGFINTIGITAVPEPASMSILGLGGLALLRRRRRA